MEAGNSAHLGGFPMALSATALAPIAAQLRIPAAALVALPVAVEAFARNAGMPEGRMVIELLKNAPLRDYLAQVCISTYEVAL
jgi:hypothetical protein